MSEIKKSLFIFIKKNIEKSRMTQIQICEILKIGQSKVSKLLSMKDSFSVWKLFSFVNALGFDIEIIVKNSEEKIGKISFFKECE